MRKILIVMAGLAAVLLVAALLAVGPTASKVTNDQLKPVAVESGCDWPPVRFVFNQQTSSYIAGRSSYHCHDIYNMRWRVSIWWRNLSGWELRDGTGWHMACLGHCVDKSVGPVGTAWTRGTCGHWKVRSQVSWKYTADQPAPTLRDHIKVHYWC